MRPFASPRNGLELSEAKHIYSAIINTSLPAIQFSKNQTNDRAHTRCAPTTYNNVSYRNPPPCENPHGGVCCLFNFNCVSKHPRDTFLSNMLPPSRRSSRHCWRGCSLSVCKKQRIPQAPPMAALIFCTTLFSIWQESSKNLPYFSFSLPKIAQYRALPIHKN